MCHIRPPSLKAGKQPRPPISKPVASRNLMQHVACAAGFSGSSGAGIGLGWVWRGRNARSSYMLRYSFACLPGWPHWPFTRILSHLGHSLAPPTKAAARVASYTVSCTPYSRTASPVRPDRRMAACLAPNDPPGLSPFRPTPKIGMVGCWCRPLQAYYVRCWVG